MNCQQTPYNKLSEKEKEIVSLLHKGAKSAIKTDDIAKRTGIKSRNIRDIIYSLITLDNYPIGSTRALPNQGYYLISNEQERNATIAVLESQIRNMKKRVSILKDIQINDF